MGFDISPAVARVHHMLTDLIANLPNLALALLVFSLFVFGARLTRRGVARLTHERVKAQNAGLAIGRLAQGAVLLFGVLVSLSVALPTFKPTDVIQLLGIGSVAIGFAFRDIFQNFLAGILLLITQPFRINDQIVVSGYEGTVEDIQTRATWIKTYDGRRVVIPNSDLFTGTVTVNTAFDRRRVDYNIGIGYGDDIELVKTLIVQAMKSSPAVLKDPAPDALVVNFGPSSVDIRARWWVAPSTQREFSTSRDQVLIAIKKVLTENGIDLPYPTQQILFHNQTEDADGDRRRQREGWPAGKDEVPEPAERNR